MALFERKYLGPKAYHIPLESPGWGHCGNKPLFGVFWTLKPLWTPRNLFGCIRYKPMSQHGNFGTLDGSEIRLSPVEIGSLSYYLQGFIHPRCRISSVNSIDECLSFFFKSNKCTAPPKFFQTQLGMALLPTSAHVSLCFYVTKWLRVKASRRPRMAFSIKVTRAWAMEFPGRMQISHNKWLLVGGWTTPFRKKTCSSNLDHLPK